MKELATTPTEWVDLIESRSMVPMTTDNCNHNGHEASTRSNLNMRRFIMPGLIHNQESFLIGSAAWTRAGTGGELRTVETVGRPPVRVPTVTENPSGFDILQKFEGTVLSTTADSLFATLVDKTRDCPDMEAEIPLDEIMPGDRELVEPGAVFYWVMGYRREPHGQVSRSSMIRFRRMPGWSAKDVEHAMQTADKFLSFLDFDRANNPA